MRSHWWIGLAILAQGMHASINLQIGLMSCDVFMFFFFSSRRRHTRFDCDWSSDVCSSDLRLADTRLVSPLTGLVLRKAMEVGETATPGAPILTLMDPNDLWLRAYVSETDLGRIRLGQAATLSVDAFPGRRFAGVIREIASEAEFTPKNVQTKKERVNLVYRVKIAVANAGGALKPGMPADAQISP